MFSFSFIKKCFSSSVISLGAYMSMFLSYRSVRTKTTTTTTQINDIISIGRSVSFFAILLFIFYNYTIFLLFKLYLFISFSSDYTREFIVPLNHHNRITYNQYYVNYTHTRTQMQRAFAQKLNGSSKYVTCGHRGSVGQYEFDFYFFIFSFLVLFRHRKHPKTLHFQILAALLISRKTIEPPLLPKRIISSYPQSWNPWTMNSTFIDTVNVLMAVILP